MDGPMVIILSEVNQLKMNIIQYHLHVESKKLVQRELIYKTEIQSQMQKTKQLLGRSMAGINWETGLDIYILLYIKQITYKDLLYLQYSIQHREFYSVLYNDLHGKRI